MKILIVTHPLGNNYGGLLQAYALQTVLRKLGHEPWVMNVSYESRKIKLLRFFRNIIYSIIGRFYVSQKDKMMISRNMVYFAKKYIYPQTITLTGKNTMHSFLIKNGFEAVVVGSDQVWRPVYLRNIYHYFLDFTRDLRIKRLSYAASFGVDSWEFSSTQTAECRKLIGKFDAVSVRENSGVVLCRDYFGREASWVLDPTMLIDKDTYAEIVKSEGETPRPEGLFCYILDKSENTTDFVQKIAKETGFSPYYCMPEEVDYAKMTRFNKDKFIYPAVTQWIRSVMDANLVLTDSFHGCVFSIIFNKPFWVFLNKQRGCARFTSLLSLFGLENRIIDLGDNSGRNWFEKINWQYVNSIKRDWGIKSLSFLSNNL